MANANQSKMNEVDEKNERSLSEVLIKKNFDKHEKKLDKHSDQIYYLNSKVQAF